MKDIEHFIRSSAFARGIDPDIAVKVAKSEGGVDESARVGKFPTGWSWWPFQLHYGGPGYEQYGTVAGMGGGFTKLTGWAPGDPAACYDSIRYALNRVKASGWGAWYGAAAVGVGQWDGIDRNHPWDADAETWDYENMATQQLAYNPDQSPERQLQSWVCSIRATSWMLKSLGLPVDIGALQDEMSPKYVTPDLGLLDARGYGIAETLKAHLPAEYRDRVTVHENVTWDQLNALAGIGPIALGLRGAYHWVNVAKRGDGGELISPNPAPSYPSEAPIRDTLSRAEFDRWGPASAVVVDMMAASPFQSPASGPRDAEIARLRAELADKDRRLAEAVNLLGFARGDVANAIETATNTLKGLVPTP